MTVETATEPLVPDAAGVRRPRVWKFIGTTLWGLLAFVALFVAQLSAVIYFLVRNPGPIDIETARSLLGNGLVISLSVTAGCPAVLAVLWIAARVARTPFKDYLALRWGKWSDLLIGIVGLGIVVGGWGLLAEYLGQEDAPGFMSDVMKSARADGTFWLFLAAACVFAPIMEEFLVRGFLYRGWSESFLRPLGAVILSSLVWTAMHVQYSPFFLGQVLSIGLWLGYLRYRSNSTWLTTVVHGINNLAATLQLLWMTKG